MTTYEKKEEALARKALRQEKNKIRTGEMIALYNSGKTLKAIGVAYGMTRESVRQILALGGTPRRSKGAYKKFPVVQVTCAECKRVFERTITRHYLKVKNHFCGRACLKSNWVKIRMSPEEKKRQQAEKAKAYYATPKGRASHFTSAEKYRKSEKGKQYFREYHKAHKK